MPGRHRRLTLPSNTSRRVGALGVAGLTGFAAALATAGSASADPAPDGANANTAPASNDQAAKPAPPKPAAQLKGRFGTGKIRVGVKIKNGDYVPDGTTTVGTQITIVETGDGVQGGRQETTCNTDASTVQPGSTASFCVFDNSNQGGGPLNDYYLSASGDTVTVTQTTVNQYLAIDSSVKSFGPCTPTQEGFCDPQQAVFVDPGLPPKAVDDSAKTKANVGVMISVLKNDDPGEPGAPVTITDITNPAHGKVLGVVGQSSRPGSGRAAPTAAKQTIEYDPDHNFTGVDHFHYTIETPNGRSTALVTVTVTAPPPVARDNSVRTKQNTAVTIDVENNDSARYPNTDLTLASVGTPKHGTAQIDGDQIVYTPDTGFSGVDTFPYTISTPFGTDTALVTVTIPAPPDEPIAVTGTDTRQGVEIGLALLLAGGGLAFAGRRRRARPNA